MDMDLNNYQNEIVLLLIDMVMLNYLLIIQIYYNIDAIYIFE